MSVTASTFRLDTDFVSLLHDRFTTAAQEARKAVKKEGADLLGFYEPSKQQLKAFIEGAFWASLTREEGRHHDFRVALMLPPYEGRYSFVFEKPLAFLPEKLAKLAPALKSSEYSIGVRTNEKEELVIWGFMEIMGMGLSIKTLGPAQILVSFPFEKQNDAFISGSRAGFVDFKKLDLLSMLEPKMAPETSLEIVLARFMTAFSRSSDLGEVARAMRAHGHGGTLLLVSAESGWLGSISQPYSYSGEPYNRVKDDLKRRERIQESVAAKKSVFPSDDYTSAIEISQTSLQSIGQLTAIDGATVVDFEMSVLAFGVKIVPLDSRKKPGRVMVTEPFEDSPEQELSISEAYGTRHQSASQFVFDQRESLAIVASQDGRLSVFGWDSEREVVTMMRHAEFALG